MPEGLLVERHPVVAGLVAAAGCLALLLRPDLVLLAASPVTVLLVLFLLLGLVGLLWPVPAVATASRRDSVAILAVGVGAFAIARLVVAGDAAASVAAVPLALNTLAAVSEEAFFRRFIFGLLEPGGTAVAVVGSATMFAVVHVAVWGAWALPLDFAAGLLLSWQRAASGRWSIPAVTHVCANALAVV